MRDRFLAALLTLAVFAVGFGAGTWAERHRPFPGPPGAFMGEFGAKRSPAPATQAPPVNRAELLEQIAKVRPEIDSFRERTDEIYAQFDKDMLTVLTPEQDATYLKKFRAQRAPQAQDEDKPLSDEEIERLLQRPFRTLAYFVVVPMTLDRMVTELKLDDAQRDKVKDFLRVRREKFIELVDSVPPPSLMLSRLAPMAQRLSQPPKP
jgi:Spy/CpxP family protein refolding chaperone